MIEIVETLKVFSMFGSRKSDSNKGDFGRGLIFAGSYGMAGAAAIAAKGCIKCGAGLTDIACPESIYPILATMLPEAIFHPLPQIYDIEYIHSLLKKSSAAAIGCGMGKSDFTCNILKAVIENSKIPIIIDADGINCLSDNIEWLQSAKCPIILTPHMGEMSRLTGMSIEEIRISRMKTALDFSEKYNVHLVLKGHETIICSPDGAAAINTTGNAGMAVGGCGDLLTGMILSFLAQKMPVADSVIAGVHLHGMAGNIAVKKTSEHCLTPNDMIDVLPEIFLQIEDLANAIGRS